MQAVTQIVRALDQITLTDITDNYTVELSQDSYVFTGDSPTGASSGSCSTTVKVFRGSEELKKQKSGQSNYPVLKSITVGNLDTVIATTMHSGSGAWSGDTWTPYQLDVSIRSGQTLSIAKEVPMTITIAFSSSSSDDIVLTKSFMVTTTKKGVDGTSIGISATHIYYGYSDNGTQSSSVTNWVENTIPSVTAGNYLWTKTVVIYNDSETNPTTTTSYSVSYKALNGVSSYTHIKYSADDDTTSSGAAMHDTLQTGDKYIGVDITTSSTPSSTKGDYDWSKFIGDDGQDATQYYTYVRYSEHSDGSGYVVTPTSATKYIGISVTTATSAPAYDDASWKWSKYVGQDGSNGASIVWKGDSASPPANAQVLWAYYNTAEKKSYVCTSTNPDVWSQMTADGNDATQYYYHVVYCNNTSTGDGYSTTASNQTYTGTYTDTTVADASNWQTAQTKNIKWNYTKGADGYNTGNINLYKCVQTQPSKPYASTSGTITYTFSTNSFSPSPSDSWSMTYPAVGSGYPVWVSTINLSSATDTITIDKSAWSTPVIQADETQSVYISASADTFKSSDGGSTYTPSSIALTPRFQNCTYNQWYYLNPSTSSEEPITNQTGLTINSSTKVLTIQNITTATSPFYSVDALTFKCEAYIGTSSNNTKVSDYFTVIKVRDGAGISSVEIKYAQSSSGTTPPTTSSSDWKDSVAAVGAIPAGHFLWTRTKFTYTDGTTSDYTYTKAMQGLTGKGIASITPLHYLRVIVEGYKSGGTFYEDSAHTKAITPVDNCYYLDKGVTPNKYWQYVTNAYVDKGTTAPPDPPSAPHQESTGAQADDISNDTKPNQWTTNTPRYISGGTYYISEEVAYDDNTYQYSAVVPDNIVTDAYMDIDRNTGQINIISEQVLNLEQTDNVEGASIRFQKKCYVGTLHRLIIAPTGNTEARSVKGLYPSTSLYPNGDLFPREIILVVDCGSSAYGTKYKYYLDIDALTWTNADVYDEFVYEDGKCWIKRKTLNGGSIVETDEYRNPVIPVDPVITVGTEEIQVSNSLIYIPQESDVTLRLVGANSSANPVINYKATYLIDNPYTSNFTSSLDLISQINMSPGSIKIKANNIALEGYTTINDGFKIDLQGNMECMDANINGSLVTKDGVLASITYTGDFYTHENAFARPRTYRLNYMNTLNFLGLNADNNGSTWAYYYAFLNFRVLIPNNFIPVKMNIAVHSEPAKVGYSSGTPVSASLKNVAVYSISNLEEVNTLWLLSEAVSDGCVPDFHLLDIPAHSFATGVADDWVFEGDAANIFTNGPGLYNIALRNADALPDNQSNTSTVVNKIASCSGVVAASCQVIGYMNTNVEGGE